MVASLVYPIYIFYATDTWSLVVFCRSTTVRITWWGYFRAEDGMAGASGALRAANSVVAPRGGQDDSG